VEKTPRIFRAMSPLPTSSKKKSEIETSSMVTTVETRLRLRKRAMISPQFYIWGLGCLNEPGPLEHPNFSTHFARRQTNWRFEK
jgi:hypothetical protein